MLLKLLTNLCKSHLHIHLFISMITYLPGKAFTNTCVLPSLFLLWFGVSKASLWASDIVLLCSLPSLRPRSASACGSCEHVRMSSGLQCISGSTSHLHPTSSLGLLQLVSERGISAATHPSSPLIRTLTASSEERQWGFDGREQGKREKERQRNIFSVNLVEKLRSLGLYKVVARGVIDFGRKEKPDPNNSPPWNAQSCSPLKVPFRASRSFWHAAKLSPFVMGRSGSHISWMTYQVCVSVMTSYLTYVSLGILSMDCTSIDFMMKSNPSFLYHCCRRVF